MPLQMPLRPGFCDKQCKILYPPILPIPVKSYAFKEDLECHSMAVDASHQNAILCLFQEEHIASEVQGQPDHVR